MAPGADGSQRSRPASALLLYVIYLISGAAALLYEIVWTRLLTLDLGHTVAAATAVLAAFMGGLAGGSALGARLAADLGATQALRSYARLELAIGAYASAFPLLLFAARPMLAFAYGVDGGSWFAVLRVGLALALVGIPASFMGATYPLMIRAAGDEPHSTRPSGGAVRVGHHAAKLYAVNTLGAAIGALVTGFVLLPKLGMLRTTFVGVAVNVALAALAWRLSFARLSVDPLSKTTPQPATHAGPDETARVSMTAPLIVVAVSGAAALTLEIAWTRTLAMIVGPTTYAFSAMLSSFILALAAGAAAGTWVARRTGRPEVWLAAALASAGVAVVAGAAQVDGAVVKVARVAAEPAATLASMVAAQLATAFALLGPMACCFGAVFPLALRVAGASCSPRRAGLLYAANTAGAIAGSLLAGFLLIPLFGLQGTLRATIAALGVAAAALAVSIARRSLVFSAMVCMFALIASFGALRVDWDEELLSAGGYKYAPYLTSGHLDAVLAAGRLQYYREGAASTVAVRDLAGVRSLAIDGKVDASNGGDMLTQKLLAHVPLILHGSAARVGIVGLGSGVTAGSALTHGPAHVDVVEISPQVVEAASWFERENGRVLNDRRVSVIVTDARTHFRLGRARYDVIVSEPSNPWMSGVAALFTREFFDSLRASLAPGGIICQWTQTYDLTPADLRSIVSTFIAVLPQTMLWLVGDGDLLLIGSTAPLEPRLDRLQAGFGRAEVARDLASVGVTGPAVLASLILGGPELAMRWSRGAEMQADDRMALEFSAPAETIGRSRHDNAAELRSAAAGAMPAAAQSLLAAADAATLRDIGLMHVHAEAMHAGWHWLSKSGDALLGNAAALRGLTRAAAATGRISGAEALLRAVIRRHPSDAALRVELSRVLLASGRTDEALTVAQELTSIDPVAAADQTASLAADLQNVELLSAAVRQLERLAPAATSTFYYRATLALLTGDGAAAVADASRAAQLSPDDYRVWNVLGAALSATQAPHEQVRDAFGRAIRADPRDTAGYVNAGLLELQFGNVAAASGYFAEALVIDPENSAAREGLARASASKPKP